jgi:mRNA-degrading endonuclease toxin of MazEF toxin-antitoxin module
MKRGDVILAIVPHSSGTSSKNRPPVVVQSDYYNQRIRNVLVATVTSNLARQYDAAHLLIEVSTIDG